MRGAELRVRPVVMTSLTAALGLFPAAMATSIGSQAQKPLAIVVVGGMLCTLFLTRYLMPVLYSFFPAPERPGAWSKRGPHDPHQSALHPQRRGPGVGGIPVPGEVPAGRGAAGRRRLVPVTGSEWRLTGYRRPGPIRRSVQNARDCLEEGPGGYPRRLGRTPTTPRIRSTVGRPRHAWGSRGDSRWASSRRRPRPQAEPIRLELLGTTEYVTDTLTKIRLMFKGRVDKVYTHGQPDGQEGRPADRPLQHRLGRGEERLRDRADPVALRQQPAQDPREPGQDRNPSPNSSSTRRRITR